MSTVPPQLSRRRWGALRGLAGLALVLATAVLGAPAGAQQVRSSAEDQHPARTLRLPVPRAEQVRVRRGIVFQPAAEAELSLSFDLYLPPELPADPALPVVVFVNGVGYRDLKDWAQYTSWARAAACEGLAAVTYQATTNRAGDDLDALMSYLTEHHADLSIDASNVAWWACSDNVQVALPLSMSGTRKFLRCAVFYYGMPEQLPTVVRPDLAYLIVKAGVDKPELNARIDAFAAQAAAANVDLTYIVHASARHAFDVTEDSVRTRDVIQDTLKFLRLQLSRELQKESEVAAIERRARLAYFRSDWADMLKAYDELTRIRPEDGEAHYRLGYARTFLGKYEEAEPAFERAAALDYLKASSTYNVACCRSRMGDVEGGLVALEQALERGFDNRALLKEDPDLATLRGDPRYAELMKKWLERKSGDQKP